MKQDTRNGLVLGIYPPPEGAVSLAKAKTMPGTLLSSPGPTHGVGPSHPGGVSVRVTATAVVGPWCSDRVHCHSF